MLWKYVGGAPNPDLGVKEASQERDSELRSNMEHGQGGENYFEPPASPKWKRKDPGSLL